MHLVQLKRHRTRLYRPTTSPEVRNHLSTHGLQHLVQSLPDLRTQPRLGSLSRFTRLGVSNGGTGNEETRNGKWGTDNVSLSLGVGTPFLSVLMQQPAGEPAIFCSYSPESFCLAVYQGMIIASVPCLLECLTRVCCPCSLLTQPDLLSVGCL